MTSFRQIRTFSDAIALVFDVIREYFKPLLMVTVRICGPWLVIGWVSASLLAAEIFGSITSAVGAEYDDWAPAYQMDIFTSVLTWLGLGFVALVMLGVAVTMHMCIVYVSVRSIAERGVFPSVLELKAAVKELFWKVFAAALVSNVVVIIAQQFFYIPGVFLSVPMALLAVVIVVEGASFATAFSRVFDLIKRRWWYSFGIIVVASLTQWALLMVLAAPVIFLFLGASVLVPELPDFASIAPLIAALSTVVVLLALALSNTVLYCAHMVLYYQVSERYDGTELAARVAQLAPQGSV